ncbi:hypothetical protein CHLNCDRAFT_142692 [Chlorella variabilis]|uniref:Methyltransferase type 11 domain-containing protein n=1 Tax=Chlorella variabilis TaxID=554065 RepID=E1Z8H8_CHLVA|nr:hypothetical protein CHLNCDRAFT_142692 [Chlorella variabilis]EFN57612.1 hypothetical protein CHLNCDRAFT_142692 [Chlorella variabilis]|eukprot:XP_005849714.1 hypothetical protein CHLNCDRAFT_142692 [Chlorella variabilis]
MELEKAYDRYAATYDLLDGGDAAEQLGFPALRQQLLRRAQGAVLETAIGTGLNLPFYDTAALASLTAIDLSSGMLARARQRAEQLGMADSVQLVQADVEHLQEALGGRAFDTVVDTFSLCVFPDPGAAIREMAACLRPGGVLLLLEHSRSEFGPLGWYQDVTAPAVMAAGKGCRWNDNVSQHVEAAGLKIKRVERHVAGLIVSVVAVKPSVGGVQV